MFEAEKVDSPIIIIGPEVGLDNFIAAAASSLIVYDLRLSVAPRTSLLGELLFKAALLPLAGGLFPEFVARFLFFLTFLVIFGS